MWLELSSGRSLLLHMGMTGALIIENEEVPQYKAFKVDATAWPPRFTKLELELSNGTRIAFCDPRRLGRIKLRESPALQFPPLSTLALDPYLEKFDVKYLDLKLSSTSAPIKAVLLEQDRVFSGIGNYLADEVLYQSAIHPKAPSNTLSEQQMEALMKSIVYVINTAVDFHCSGKEFPENWIFHKRWSKGKKVSDNKLNGRNVTFETVGGRTSAVVIGWQKMGAKAKKGNDVSIKTKKEMVNVREAPKKKVRKDDGKQAQKNVNKVKSKVKVEVESKASATATTITTSESKDRKKRSSSAATAAESNAHNQKVAVAVAAAATNKRRKKK